MLYFFNEEKLLWVVNMVLLGIVLWNFGMCVVSKVGVV